MRHLGCLAGAGKGAASCRVRKLLPVLVKLQDSKGCCVQGDYPNGHEKEPHFAESMLLRLTLSLGLFLFVLQSVLTKAVFPPVQVPTAFA